MAFRTNKTPVLQTKSASGEVASFNTALAMPLVNGEFTIQAYQEGSGDPSPDNVRNIVGFDKLRIDMVNWNNLYDFTENSTRWKTNGLITRTWNDGVLTISNGNTNSSYAYQELQETSGHKMLYIVEGQSVDPVDRGCALSFYTAAATTNITKYFSTTRMVLSGIFASKTTMINKMQFRPNNTQSKLIIYKSILVDLTQAFGSRIADYLYTLETAQEGAGVAIFKQLFYKDYYDYNVGGTWVSVASVNGDSYPDYAEVALGEDVYGAVYNSVTGDKTTNRIKLALDSLNWNYNANEKLFSAILRTPAKDIHLTNEPVPMCDIFKGIRKASEKIDGSIMNGYADNYLFQLVIYTTSITSKEQLDEIIQGHEVVYTIRDNDRIITQIGATPISTNIGNNTIFADTGDIDLTFKDLDIAKRGNFREVFRLPS